MTERSTPGSAHMASMLIDYWNCFGDTPLRAGLNSAIGIVYVFYAVTILVNRRTVSGTHRAYRSATIIKTLIWPLFAAYAFSFVMDPFTQEWIGAFFDAWIGSILLRDWEKYKDTDDWWRGRGAKLKKKLRSMFRAPASVLASAGAGA